MPDKWEFPWFASWDLGFHCVTLAHVDPQFAKDQILLMLREWTMHPNGQIPAYEWDFNDVNPPVLSMAAVAVFEIERHRTGVADYDFLERVFQKMLLNFTWWVNRKDAMGKNIFQGGFLGMDNIGVFDRDDLPPGWLLGQADGTSWMALFAKSLLTIALKLAERNPVYEDVASKFWEHYVYIANAMNSLHDPEKSLWNEADGFFYDHLLWQGKETRAPPRPFDGRLRPDLRRLDGAGRHVRPLPGLQPAPRLVHLPPPGPDGERRADGRPRTVQHADPRARPRGPAATDAGDDARRRRVPLAGRRPVGLALPQGPPARPSPGRAGVPAGLRAGRIQDGPLRRQLELAGAGLAAGQLDDHPRAPELPPLLRRHVPGGVPDGVGEDDDPPPGRRGDRRMASIFLRTRKGSARSSATADSSRPIRTGAT